MKRTSKEEKKKKAHAHWVKLVMSWMFKDNWYVFVCGVIFGFLLDAIGHFFNTLWR